MNQPLVFCPYLYNGDKRCIPSKLSSRNIEQLISVCAIGWKECALYEQKRNETVNRVSNFKQEITEIDAAEIEKILSDSVEGITEVPEFRNGNIPEIEEPLISSNIPVEPKKDESRNCSSDQEKPRHSQDNHSFGREDYRNPSSLNKGKEEERTQGQQNRNQTGRSNSPSNGQDRKNPPLPNQGNRNSHQQGGNQNRSGKPARRQPRGNKGNSPASGRS